MFYYLIYNVGTHYITINADKEDFFRVVNDLSDEFEIVKKYDDNIPCKEVYYYRDYYDELCAFGSIYTIEES